MPKQPAEPKKKGRPRIDIPAAIRRKICREVALGKSLRRVLAGKGMPSMGKVMEELQIDTAFAEQYARARKAGIELHIDGIVDLADSATAENAHAVRLRVDTRKWIASKLVPKVYGDHVDLSVDADVRVERDMNDPATFLDTGRRLAFILAMADRAARDAPEPPALLPAPAEIEINPRPEVPPEPSGNPGDGLTEDDRERKRIVEEFTRVKTPDEIEERRQQELIEADCRRQAGFPQVVRGSRRWQR